MIQDKEFIDFIVDERMRINYENWADRPHPDMNEVSRIDRAYLEAIESLREETRKAIKDYYTNLIDDLIMETRFFYRCGVEDGYKLCKHMENILHT